MLLGYSKIKSNISNRIEIKVVLINKENCSQICNFFAEDNKGYHTQKFLNETNGVHRRYISFSYLFLFTLFIIELHSNSKRFPFVLTSREFTCYNNISMSIIHFEMHIDHIIICIHYKL